MSSQLFIVLGQICRGMARHCSPAAPAALTIPSHVVDAQNSGRRGSCGSCVLVLANFSVLAPPRRHGLHIATAKPGITFPQIQQLLDFVFSMVNMVGACGRFAETFGEERGRPLSFEAFHVYHENSWIIGPATAATDAHEACSYVELLGLRNNAAKGSPFSRMRSPSQVVMDPCSRGSGSWRRLRVDIRNLVASIKSRR